MDQENDQRIGPTTKRAITPTLLQMEAVECGACALCIVMSYYKKFVPLTQCRIDCGISRDGSKANHIVKAARDYGFTAIGYHKDLHELTSLSLPYIVYWNFNHFIVVEGFAKDKVYINDPASGPRVISFTEFDHGFTGVVLHISPGKHFTPSGAPDNIIKAIKKRLPGSFSTLIYLIAIGILLIIPLMLAPVFTKIFVDNYLVAQLQSWVGPLLIGMAITGLVRALLSWMQNYYFLKLETKMAVSGSSQFLWQLLHKPIDFYKQRASGDLSHRVALNDKVATILAQRVIRLCLDAVLVVFSLVLMLFYDVFLTLLGIAIAFCHIWIAKVLSQRVSNENRRLTTEQGKIMGTVMMGMNIIETLKASGTQREFFAKLMGHQTKAMNCLQTLESHNITLATLPVLFMVLNMAAILTLGGLRVMDGLLTVGALVALLSLMQSFLRPFAELLSAGNMIQELRGDMSRLDDVLGQKKAPAVHAQGMQKSAPPPHIAKLSGLVEIKNLSFAYSRFDASLLRDINLRLEPGERVACVGATGSGKSTLGKLLLNLYEPWQGEIRYDGDLIKDLNRHVFLNSVAMVDQDIAIFPGSIRDNITLWDRTIDERTIIEAAHDACLHDAIISRAGAYDSPLRQGGRNLSGGERQRLEITRALVRCPRFIVFDEATSSLDALTELAISDHIKRRGCTSLIIAHRLSTIRCCDKIIVLDQGRIVQTGTHQALITQAGPYRKLVGVSE